MYAHLVFLECCAQNPKNVVKNDIKKGAKVKDHLQTCNGIKQYSKHTIV